MRVLLAPLGDGGALGLHPAARLLGDRLALVEQPSLADDLEVEGPLHGPERVHVLDLDLDPELGLAAAPQRLAAFGLVVGAAGNAMGRIFSGWMSDALGRINVLRLMIGISMVAMPILYYVGGNVVALFVMLFIVYWCYGTQLSVNGSTAADFWGTKNVGLNYGMLFTAWGVAGLLGGRIGGWMFDKYHNYQMAFYTAAGLAAVALICELAAKRPEAPEGVAGRKTVAA